MSRQNRHVGVRVLGAFAAVVTAGAMVVGGGTPSATAAPSEASAWRVTTPFDQGRTSAVTVRDRNHLYVVGGYSYDAVAQQLNVYTDVQYATVGHNGAIVGGWHTTTPFETPRLGQGGIVWHHRLYVIAGSATDFSYLDDVQYADLNPDGTIAAGGWHTSPYHLNIPRSTFGTQVAVVDGTPYLYVIGGVGNDAEGNTVHFNHVEFARLFADGSLGPWHVDPYRFDKGRSAPATAIVGGCIYVIGGWGDALTDIFADVQYACLRPDGSTGPWTTSPNSLRIQRYAPATFVVRRGPGGCAEVVVAGGNAGGGTYLNEVEHARICGAAGTSPWYVAPTRAWLPQAEWGQGGVLYRHRAYVLGGVNRPQDYLDQVIYTPVGQLLARRSAQR